MATAPHHAPYYRERQKKTPTACQPNGKNAFLTPNLANTMTPSGEVRPSRQELLSFLTTARKSAHFSQKPPPALTVAKTSVLQQACIFDEGKINSFQAPTGDQSPETWVLPDICHTDLLLCSRIGTANMDSTCYTH